MSGSLGSGAEGKDIGAVSGVQIMKAQRLHGTFSCRQWEVLEGLEQRDNGHIFTSLTRAQGSVKRLQLQTEEK